MRVTMYDSTSANDIPVAAAIVGGYINGQYRWKDGDWQRFSGRRVPIWVFIPKSFTTDAGVFIAATVDATADAAAACGYVHEALGLAGATIVIDVEGQYLVGAEQSMAVQYTKEWCEAVRAHGYSPTTYTSLSTNPSIAGLGDDQWIADYFDDAHAFDIPGAAATQYASPTEIVGHPHYDLSSVPGDWPRSQVGLIAPVPVWPNVIAAALNFDGRLELFGVNSRLPADQANVYHAWQLTPGGDWSGWAPLSHHLTGITAAANSDGRLEVFGVNAEQGGGQDNVYHAWQTSPGGPWSDWASIPGHMTSVGAATNKDGRVELFGANADQPDGQSNVYHRWQINAGSGTWSEWVSMAGSMTSVAVATNRDGRLEVFGANGRLPEGHDNVSHIWQTTPGGSWADWASIPGHMTSVGAATNKDGRVELFGANADQPDGQDNVHHRWQIEAGSGTWSDWAGIAGYLTSIAAANNRDGRLEVFGANAHQPDDQDNTYHRWQTLPGSSGWSDWAIIPRHFG